jgi:methanogenic corrinoid protein MtbC1
MSDSINVYTADFLKYLLSGNRQKCSAISREYLAQNSSVKDLYENVFKKALYEVGLLWETNKISVATEHLATAITEGILNELYAELESEEKQNNKVVLTCVENELHQVGIKMVADVFEMHGWDSYFLGTGIPTSELVNYIKEVNPNILGISLSIFFNYQNLLRMLTVLRNEFPDLTIIVGGQAFMHITEENFKKINGIKYFSNLYDLDNYLKST